MSDTDRHTDDAGPRPGDGRDRGPRPTATGADLGWASVAGVLVTVTVVQLAALVLRLGSTDGTSSGGLVAAFLITLLWLLTITWLALGAWRRSVFGCPFRHTIEDAASWRCPRHRLVGPDDDPEFIVRRR